MALTADQITAQNFKDFYAEIRPFLNGNSPLAVNTFNKSDLYDTTEKVVGRWIDGKPIYLKVLVLETNVQQNGWIPYPNNTIDILIKYGGTAYFRTERHKRPFPWDVEGNYANINSWNSNGLEYSTNSTNNVLMSGSMIWLIYTKTNDTQMSISDGNEYSTDEQLVGHWIDGKPVYQKTFTGTTTATTSSDSVAGTIATLGTLVDSNGTIFLEGDWGVNQHSLPYDNVAEYYVDTSNRLIVHKQNEIANSKEYMITLRYTKTTD